MSRTAWLLSGGTVLGADTLIPIQNLVRERGWPDAIYGVSVGSVNGAKLAEGTDMALSELIEMWRAVDGAGDFQKLNLPDLWDGLFHFGPLKKKLRRHVSTDRMQIECFAGHVDLADKAYRNIRLNNLPNEMAWEAIIGSSTQSGIHEEAFIQGRPVTDGGVLRVLPDMENWADFDEFHCFFCSPTDRRVPVAPGDVGLHAGRALRILIDQVVEKDLLRIQRWANAGKRVWVYAPPVDPGDPFDASHETIRWRIDELGQQVWETRKVLQPDVEWLESQIELFAGRDGLNAIEQALLRSGTNLRNVLLRGANSSCVTVRDRSNASGPVGHGDGGP